MHRITGISMWKERWFLSCNAKDIGTLYLIFALFSGLLGTAYSVLQTLLMRAYTSLEWCLNSPPKPHAFASLPLQSDIM